jgi:hypothetical protein
MHIHSNAFKIDSSTTNSSFVFFQEYRVSLDLRAFLGPVHFPHSLPFDVCSSALLLLHPPDYCRTEWRMDLEREENHRLKNSLLNKDPTIDNFKAEQDEFPIAKFTTESSISHTLHGHPCVIFRGPAPSPTALIRWMRFCRTLKLTISNTDQPSPPGKASRGVSLTPRSTQRRILCTFATHREALPGLHLRRWSILRPPRALPPRFSF